MGDYKEYKYNKPFTTECGDVLEGLTIGYHTYGTLNADCSNAIWVCHALTANSDVADWWPHTVEQGRFLDPERYFVICANIIGSQYGSTGPLSINPKTGIPYYKKFPLLTVRDIIEAHQLLRKHIGIDRLFALMGSSLGGFQAMEWAIIYPDTIERLLLIATASRAMPWATALNESQRMAIECDPTYGEMSDSAGSIGMQTARSIALLSYRGQRAYDKTQAELQDLDKISGFRASSYQRYQGEKLTRRFSAYTYHLLTRILDTHNVGRGRGSREQALGLINTRCTVIAVSSDILFPPEEHQYLAKWIKGAVYRTIDSEFGHDGFLVEHEQLDRLIQEAYSR